MPVLAATSAAAAEPTSITVSPTSITADVSGTTGSADLTATLVGASAPFPLAHGVYYRVTAGPDETKTTTGMLGTECQAPAGAAKVTCTVTNTSGEPGTDTVEVFYDAIAPATFYQSGDPVATASVTFAGAYTVASVSPTTNKVATNSVAAYTVKGTDVNGTPASGQMPVKITQTLPTTDPATANPLYFADPTNSTFPATPLGSAGDATVSGLNTVYTQTMTVSLHDGQATIGVGSSVAGSVTVTAGANDATHTAGTAALTVSAGNADASGSIANNDVATAVTLQTPTTTSFTTKDVTEKVKVTNAAGDALGGVSVEGKVTSGPSATAAVEGSTTDQFGMATLSYTAAATAGTDNVQVWINQDTHNPNTAGFDAGEPQATGTVSLVASLTHVSFTSTAAQTLQLTQKTASVTFTLKSGTPQVATPNMTLDLALDTTSVTKGVTLSASTGVTDASGQVTVTVTEPDPTDEEAITVTGTLHGDADVTADSVITYAASTVTKATVTPLAQTLSANSTGTTITETVTVVDNFNNPVENSNVSWVITGRNGPETNDRSTGSGTTDASGVYTVSYVDAGKATKTPAIDTIAITTVLGTQSATVNYLAGSAMTKTLTLNPDLTTTGTTSNPVSPATSPVVTLTAHATDETEAPGDNILQNKAVTFSRTGAGMFADENGVPISGTSQTVNTDEDGNAIVYVRSTTTGTQTVTATSDGVTSAAAVVTYTNQYVGITPQRVVDTRTGQGSLQTAGGGNAPAVLAPNTNYVFNIHATNLPLDQEAYAFNVTAIGATALGNLRIAPSCDAATPATSLVNYQPGKDVANFVVVPNGCNQLTVYSDNSPVAVAIDAVGYYPATSPLTTGTPTRVVDTRTGLGGSTGPVVGGATARVFQVDMTSTDKAVALNLTAINPTGLGNLRVYPDGATMPLTSNVNYIPGVDKSAFVIVNVPASGKIDVYSDGGSADVAIDVFATFPAGSNLVTASPVRIADTRTGANISAGGTLNVQVTGKAGVPADAQAVLVSVTGIHTVGSTGIGNLRVFPAGGAVPTISTLNYVSSTSDVANFAIVKIGANGQISLYSDGSPIDAAVDVLGYVPAGTPAA